MRLSTFLIASMIIASSAIAQDKKPAPRDKKPNGIICSEKAVNPEKQKPVAKKPSNKKPAVKRDPYQCGKCGLG